MFEAKVDGTFLRKLTEALKDICADINIECDGEGVEMQAMDNSHVALVYLILSSEFFDYYRCDKKVILGINVAQMMKVLSCVKEGHIIVLQKSDEADDPILNIFIDEAETERMHVEMKLVDIEKEHLQVPEQDYSCITSLSSKKFQDCIKHLNSFAETVTISMKRGSMSLTAEGPDARVTKEFCQSDRSDDVTVECKEQVTQEFACRVLHLFARAAALAPLVKIYQTQDVPLALKFDINKQKAEVGHISFFLSPKIEE